MATDAVTAAKVREFADASRRSTQPVLSGEYEPSERRRILLGKFISMIMIIQAFWPRLGCK